MSESAAGCRTVLNGECHMVPVSARGCQMVLDCNLLEDVGVERCRIVPVAVGRHSTVLCLRGAHAEGFQRILDGTQRYSPVGSRCRVSENAGRCR